MDGWRGVVKYKVNYLTLSRYEEAHRRLNIDAPAYGGKMKGTAFAPGAFNNEFRPPGSRISTPTLSFSLNAPELGEKRIGCSRDSASGYTAPMFVRISIELVLSVEKNNSYYIYIISINPILRILKILRILEILKILQISRFQATQDSQGSQYFPDSRSSKNFQDFQDFHDFLRLSGVSKFSRYSRFSGFSNSSRVHDVSISRFQDSMILGSQDSQNS